MSPAFVLLAMLFLHVLDDFGLQGVMAGMKQKSWWGERTQDPKYRFDYVPVLFCHAFSWSFAVMLPIAAYRGFAVDDIFAAAVVLNTAAHAWVDDMKANRLKLTLVQDQLCHVAQVLITFAAFMAA